MQSVSSRIWTCVAVSISYDDNNHTMGTSTEQHQGIKEETTPFPGLLHFTLNTYLILLSVKQGGNKYHF